MSAESAVDLESREACMLRGLNLPVHAHATSINDRTAKTSSDPYSQRTSDSLVHCIAIFFPESQSRPKPAIARGGGGKFGTGCDFEMNSHVLAGGQERHKR
jgi:hypothetical protein